MSLSASAPSPSLSPETVPEPGTLALLIAGLVVGFAALRRRGGTAASGRSRRFTRKSGPALVALVPGSTRDQSKPSPAMPFRRVDDPRLPFRLLSYAALLALGPLGLLALSTCPRTSCGAGVPPAPMQPRRLHHKPRSWSWTRTKRSSGGRGVAAAAGLPAGRGDPRGRREDLVLPFGPDDRGEPGGFALPDDGRAFQPVDPRRELLRTLADRTGPALRRGGRIHQRRQGRRCGRRTGRSSPPGSLRSSRRRTWWRRASRSARTPPGRPG